MVEEQVVEQITEPSETTPEPDWKALATEAQTKVTEAEAKVKKLENDLRGIQTGRARTSERDETLRSALRASEEARDEAKVANETIKAFLIAQGDNEGAAKLEKQRTDAATRRTQQTWAQSVQDTNNRVWEIGKALGVDPNKHPEFEEVGRLYDEAHKTGDITLLKDAVIAAQEARARIMAQPKAEETETEETKAVVKPPTDLGKGAGGSRVGMTWTQAQKIKNINDLSDEDYEKLIAKE